MLLASVPALLPPLTVPAERERLRALIDLKLTMSWRDPSLAVPRALPFAGPARGHLVWGGGLTDRHQRANRALLGIGRLALCGQQAAMQLMLAADLHKPVSAIQSVAK